MFRKLCSAVVVPVLLILLTAGAVQARPLQAQVSPAGLLTQAWQALSSAWTGLWIKEGLGMDPNGGTPHGPVLRPLMRGERPSPALPSR
jgi:hypothetical protein